MLVVPRDSGGASTGFCWCILTDKRTRYKHPWSFCGKCYDWGTIEGLQVMHNNVVSHYQNYWYIFCGRSVLKRVRNVTGMMPWRRLVASYYCFILCNVYVCLHFAAMCDNLHCTMISSSLLWKSSRFGVIFFIHDASSLHRILLVNHNGFCDSWLQRNSRIYTSKLKKIFVSNISSSRLLTKLVTSLL